MFYTIIKCVHFKLPTIFHSPGVARCGAKGNVNWSNCGKWVPSCLLFICVCMSCVADYCDRNMQQRNSNSGDGEYFTFGFAKTHGDCFMLFVSWFQLTRVTGGWWSQPLLAYIPMSLLQKCVIIQFSVTHLWLFSTAICPIYIPSLPPGWWVVASSSSSPCLLNFE